MKNRRRQELRERTEELALPNRYRGCGPVIGVCDPRGENAWLIRTRLPVRAYRLNRHVLHHRFLQCNTSTIRRRRLAGRAMGVGSGKRKGLVACLYAWAVNLSPRLGTIFTPVIKTLVRAHGTSQPGPLACSVHTCCGVQNAIRTFRSRMMG